MAKARGFTAIFGNEKVPANTGRHSAGRGGETANIKAVNGPFGLGRGDRI